jgi:protein unc-13
MINIQQAADSSKIIELTKKIEGLTKQIKELEKGQSAWENIIGTLDVLVWPIALIVCLYLFKKQIASIIDRFESANVSATGVSFQLKKATQLIGEGSSAILPKSGSSIIPKDGSSIIPKDGSSIIPKDGSSIIPKSGGVTPSSVRNHAESPYQGLIELQDAIREKLTNTAKEKGYTTTSSSNFDLVSDLVDNKLIDSHTAHKLKTLIELNTMSLNSPNISHEHVTQMKKLFNNISF